MRKLIFLFLTACVVLLTGCYSRIDINEQDMLQDAHSLLGKSRTEVRDYCSDHGFTRRTSGDDDEFTGSTHDGECHISLSPTYVNDLMQDYDLEVVWKGSTNMVSAINLALNWEQYAFSMVFPRGSWEANFHHGIDDNHYTAAERSTFRSDVEGFIEEDHLDVHYQRADSCAKGELSVSTMLANQVLQTNIRFVYTTSK